MRSYGGILFVALAATLIPSCDEPVSVYGITALQQAERRWAAQALHSYKYETLNSCFCSRPTTEWCLIEANADTITKVSSMETGDPVDHSDFMRFDTVDERFALIYLLMKEGGTAELTMEFDPVFGYPTMIRVEGDGSATDLGGVFYARNLQPLP